MSLFSGLRRLIQGSQPTIVDFEAYQEQAPTGTDGPILRRLGPEGILPPAGAYKIQQSYDSLLQTVRELREALDGQAKRQDDLLTRLGALPHAVEALPQTSRMQNDMLRMINERLALHAEQQRRIHDAAGALAAGKPGQGEVLQAIRDQIEMGNEIDRQLVESFNRFSMMIDRLQMANHHAVECLQQVHDSYAASALHMQEWVEKSRHRNSWMIAAAFIMSGLALGIVVILIYLLSTVPLQPADTTQIQLKSESPTPAKAPQTNPHATQPRY